MQEPQLAQVPDLGNGGFLRGSGALWPHREAELHGVCVAVKLRGLVPHCCAEDSGVIVGKTSSSWPMASCFSNSHPGKSLTTSFNPLFSPRSVWGTVAGLWQTLCLLTV